MLKLVIARTGRHGAETSGGIHGEGLDVVHQGHVVVGNELGGLAALEHIIAVAHLLQQVGTADHGVGLGKVDGLIGIGGLVQDLDLFHPVGAGRTAGPDQVLILLNGRGGGQIYNYPHTGDLEKAAYLVGVLHVGGAVTPLQGVLQLLAGDSLDPHLVAPGVDGLEHFGVDLARGNGGADAAALVKGYIGFNAGLFSGVEEGVGTEVADVGLLLPDGALAVGAVYIQSYGGGADGLGKAFVHGGNKAGLHLCYRGVGSYQSQVVHGEKLGGNSTVGGDGQLAHIVQSGAGLGQNDLLAGLVGYLLTHDLAVGVAVDKGGEAGGVGDDVGAAPGGGGLVDAQVAQGDDVISFLGRRVDGGLDRGVEFAAVGAAGDGVDILSLIVHKILGGGFGDGLRGGDTHQSHLFTAHLKDLVGVQDQLALVIEVAGQVGVLGPLDDVHSAIHGIVKLVIAQSGGVIADGVHQVNDGMTLVLGTVRGALDMVSGVHQQNVLQAGLVTGDGGVAKLGDFGLGVAFAFLFKVVNVGVYVVGVQNGNDVGIGDPAGSVSGAPARRQLCSLNRSGQGENHSQGQEQGQKLFAVHAFHLSFPYFGTLPVVPI